MLDNVLHLKGHFKIDEAFDVLHLIQLNDVKVNLGCTLLFALPLLFFHLI